MTTLTGRCVFAGLAEGEALVSDVDLALGLIDPFTGIVKQSDHPLFGQSVAGRILVFPAGSGSSSGSYRLLHLAEQKKAPAAIVNVQANAVVTAGAVLGGIPLVHKLTPDPIRTIKTGDRVQVDGGRGVVVVQHGGSA
jgi:predicted aconitase with swiveling domain